MHLGSSVLTFEKTDNLTGHSRTQRLSDIRSYIFCFFPERSPVTAFYIELILFEEAAVTRFNKNLVDLMAFANKDAPEIFLEKNRKYTNEYLTTDIAYFLDKMEKIE